MKAKTACREVARELVAGGLIPENQEQTVMTRLYRKYREARRIAEHIGDVSRLSSLATSLLPLLPVSWAYGIVIAPHATRVAKNAVIRHAGSGPRAKSPKRLPALVVPIGPALAQLVIE